jgi:hypothetical protein
MKWWRRLLQRDRVERQLDAELRDHFDRLVADYVRSGITEAEARRRARLEFGGIEQVKEHCRDARGTRWVDELVQDLRYGVRLLRRIAGARHRREQRHFHVGRPRAAQIAARA